MEITIELLKMIGLGAFAGASAATTGFFKQWKEEGANWEKFNTVKFMTTVLIGAFVGGFAGLTGWDSTTAEQFLVSWGIMASVSYYADAIAKLLKRRILDPIWKALHED